jgi:hypothetical protein
MSWTLAVDSKIFRKTEWVTYCSAFKVTLDAQVADETRSLIIHEVVYGVTYVVRGSDVGVDNTAPKIKVLTK